MKEEEIRKNEGREEGKKGRQEEEEEREEERKGKIGEANKNKTKGE